MTYVHGRYGDDYLHDSWQPADDEFDQVYNFLEKL